MRTRTAPLPLLFLCISALVQANDDPMARFDAIMGNPEQRAQAYAAGQERITLCGYCHGEDGNSKRDYIPNLAGQNPRYLFSAFEQYVDGHRTHFVMNQAAKMLSLEERVNIAVYFSQQTVKARQSSAGSTCASVLASTAASSVQPSGTRSVSSCTCRGAGAQHRTMRIMAPARRRSARPA